MIESIISNKTRIKLLVKFFLNSGTASYLRGLEQEFGSSSNSIRIELNRMIDAGLLTSFVSGNKKMFKANAQHPLYENINSIVRKHIGIDHVVETIVAKLGNLKAVYLSGSFVKGVDSQVIDLILVGDLDKGYLVNLVEKAETLIARKVRYLIFEEAEITTGALTGFSPKPLLLWEKKEELTT